MKMISKLAITVCALSLATFVGPAGARSPLLVPVIDEEEAVEQHLEPEVVPPGSQYDAPPPKEEVQQPKREGGDIEENAVKQEFPSQDLPPSKP
jgi:hypothetical protein